MSSSSPSRPAPTDQSWFRRVLGQFPTGVVAITSTGERAPVGMIVGSFTSVSLDPPLVAFLPGKSSTSWPKIEATGHFVVNVLSSDQEGVCRTISSKDVDKFDAIDSSPGTRTGAPIIDGVLAWMECAIEAVHDAGDHWIVVGRVLDLSVGQQVPPLVFFQGGYGRFETGTRVATVGALSAQLHAINKLRPAMEALAAELDCECVAVAHSRDQMMLLASAGHAHDSDLPSRVGERVPAIAPFGRSIVPWMDDPAIDSWLRSAPPEQRAQLREMLTAIRDRGYSLTVKYPHTDVGTADRSRATELSSILDPGTEMFSDLDCEAHIHSVAVPVFDKNHHPLFALAVYGFGTDSAQNRIDDLVDRLGKVASTLYA